MSRQSYVRDHFIKLSCDSYPVHLYLITHCTLFSAPSDLGLFVVSR